jgi:2-amino-4-hydroxy-6-hydroxymethyldihydropteridine diphosphokinase
MRSVVLGLGSNAAWQGSDSIALLRAAVSRLDQVLTAVRWSSVYRTRPLYVTGQQDFYNMVVTGFCGGSDAPHRLLEEIHHIEASLGRDRSREIRNGSRSLDIDIEFYGNMRVQDTDLIIPHPRVTERGFVLIPLLEIFPESADCITRAECAALVQQLPDQGVVPFLPAENFF